MTICLFSLQVLQRNVNVVLFFSYKKMKWQKNDDRDSRENQSVTKCHAYVA